MYKKYIKLVLVLSLMANVACNSSSTNTETSESKSDEEVQKDETPTVKPVYITEKVNYDTDDPAIWLNKSDLSKSFVIGTDKNQDGALYAFDLKGAVIADKVVSPLLRPNNTDIEYNLKAGDDSIDIAVVAERLSHKIRIFRLPDMVAIDNGGIEAFVGEEGDGFRDLMGIGVYRNAEDGKVYVMVGRKNGPAEGYFWQYELSAKSTDEVEGKLVRKFGKYSGKNEIEAIAVDDEMGYVYYSDENVGIRKYYANPEKGNTELALFGANDFTEDNEGIAIYQTAKESGFIFVSDQAGGKLIVYPREGAEGNVNEHIKICAVKYKALETDGIEVVNANLNENFPKGLLVAMSDDKTFHFYDMREILKAIPK